MAPARKTRKGEDFVLRVSKASDFQLDVQTVDHDNRKALKSIWTQMPAVLVTTDDKVMQAFKVVKAKSGAFEVHFSTSPTGGLRDDVKMKSMDLWARAPRPGLKHIILGAVGGEFRDEAGERAARIKSVITSAGGSVTVWANAYKVGGRKASAKAFDWVAFWTKYKYATANTAREKTSARADKEEGSGDDSVSDADSDEGGA